MNKTIKKSKNTKLKIMAIIIAYTLMVSISNIQAIQINSSRGSYIDKGNEFTITLNFDYTIGAYDSIEVTYDSNVIEYVSGDPIKEQVWYDDTDNQTGSITQKKYKFKAINDGTTTITIKAKGLVRSNESMDWIGDKTITKNISVGRCGDINKDGKVNADDAAEVIDAFKTNNNNIQYLKIADLNNDGRLTAEDAALIIEYFKTHH